MKDYLTKKVIAVAFVAVMVMTVFVGMVSAKVLTEETPLGHFSFVTEETLEQKSTIITSQQLQERRTIIVDGDPSDWAGIGPLFTDPAGDYDPCCDITEFYVTSDCNNVYFMIKLNLPPTSYVYIHLDTDMDYNTGCQAFGVGFEYGVTIGIHNDVVRIGDARDCGWGADFPDPDYASQGNIIELAVPISTLKILTPEITGMDITMSNDDTPIGRYMLESPLWQEINAELDALIDNVSAADMPNIIKQRLLDKLEYAKELKDNAHEEYEAGNIDAATKKLGVAKSQVEAFASMVEITRRISAEDKASFLADAASIIEKIQALIEDIETEHKC